MREWIKKHTPKVCILIYQKLRYTWIVLLFYFFRLWKIQNSRVVFCNVWGYGDNARYIAEEFLQQVRRNSVRAELIFITNHPHLAKAPEGIRLLRTNSCSAIFALATAKVWVDSNRKEGYLRKRRGQYYIQTWHGGVPLKKIEGDCADYLGKTYIRRAKWDSAMTDLYLSNGGFCTKLYRRAFWYTGEILECGTPRLDCLLRQTTQSGDRVRNEYQIEKGTKLAIYAPTYRNLRETEVYLKELPELLNVLEQRFGGSFVLLVRLHPLSAGLSENFLYGKNIKNASAARDFYELLKASEVLITDYSNTMFEAALAGKTVFLFLKDWKEYEQERGLYFELKELPFPHAEKEEELRREIAMFSETEYQERVQQFFKKLQIKETGYASELAAGRILEVLKN